MPAATPLTIRCCWRCSANRDGGFATDTAIPEFPAFPCRPIAVPIVATAILFFSWCPSSVIIRLRRQQHHRHLRMNVRRGFHLILYRRGSGLGQAVAIQILLSRTYQKLTRYTYKTAWTRASTFTTQPPPIGQGEVSFESSDFPLSYNPIIYICVIIILDHYSSLKFMEYRN